VLELDPASAGLEPSNAHPNVWGALMETAYPNGVATLVGLADGTTSLYTSTGGGVIGGGEHQSVATETQAFLVELARHLDQLAPDEGDDLPAVGDVTIRALTYTGRLSIEAPQDELSSRNHPLARVFYAGHRIITALREIDEARGSPGGPQSPSSSPS
jgi:hypothetical protein